MSKPQNDGQLAELVDRIKLDIIFGRLRPRERLIEDDLSAQFGASRHLVRTAFTELQRMGLVTRRPNKGAVVRDFSPEEVDEIYEMRAILQREAASRVPLPAHPDLIARLEQIHAEYCREVDRRNLKRVCELNNEFHHTIFKASDNRCLVDLIQRMWTETLGIRCYAMGDPTLLCKTPEEHSQILNALRTGNRKRLMRLCVDHLWPALEAYKRAHGGWSSNAMQSTATEKPLRLARAFSD